MNVKKLRVLLLSRWMLLIVSLALMTPAQSAQANVFQVIIWLAFTPGGGLTATHSTMVQGNGSFTNGSPRDGFRAATPSNVGVTVATPNGQGGFNANVVRPGIPPASGAGVGAGVGTGVGAGAGAVALGTAAVTTFVVIAAATAAGAVCVGVEQGDPDGTCTSAALTLSDQLGFKPIEDFKEISDLVDDANGALNEFINLFD